MCACPILRPYIYSYIPSTWIPHTYTSKVYIHTYKSAKYECIWNGDQLCQLYKALFASFIPRITYVHSLYLYMYPIFYIGIVYIIERIKFSISYTSNITALNITFGFLHLFPLNLWNGFTFSFHYLFNHKKCYWDISHTPHPPKVYLYSLVLCTYIDTHTHIHIVGMFYVLTQYMAETWVFSSGWGFSFHLCMTMSLLVIWGYRIRKSDCKF